MEFATGRYRTLKRTVTVVTTTTWTFGWDDAEAAEPTAPNEPAPQPLAPAQAEAQLTALAPGSKQEAND